MNFFDQVEIIYNLLIHNPTIYGKENKGHFNGHAILHAESNRIRSGHNLEIQQYNGQRGNGKNAGEYRLFFCI